jgi:flagellar hook-associated protein 2
MGSPVTFGGFNQIDFNVILNAIMQQESRPLQTLQAQQTALQATDTALGQLIGKIDALRTSARALSGGETLVEHAVSSADPDAVSVTASSGAVAGRYDIVVSQLARAQVTASTTTAPDADTTIVASGGTLTVGGVTVTYSGPVTLRQIADGINAAPGAMVSAMVIQTAPNVFRLVLQGEETGAANAFTVTNGLTDSAMAFAGNAVEAADASALVNNIPVTSTTNTLTDVVAGVTVTLRRQTTDPVAITVERDDERLADRVETFVTEYNELVKFASEQMASAASGTAGSLGRDALLRTLRQSLRSTLNAAYGSDTFTRLAEVGIAFTRTGELTLDRTRLTSALGDDHAAVQSLLAGTGGGVFGSVATLLDDYTRSGGLVPGARTRLNDELSRLRRRMDDMQERLAIRRAALQQEFIAADEAMARLNGQSGALASFAGGMVGI